MDSMANIPRNCFKCWHDSMLRSEYYEKLKTHTCPPEEQISPIRATVCPECNKKTLDSKTRICYSCDKEILK